MPLAALIPMLLPLIGPLLGGLLGGGSGGSGGSAGGLGGILSSLLGGLGGGGGGGGTPNILTLLQGLGGGAGAGAGGAGGGSAELQALMGALGGGAGGITSKGGVTSVDPSLALQLAAGGKPLTEQQLALTLSGQPVRLPAYAETGLQALSNRTQQEALQNFVAMAGRAIVNRATQATQPELAKVYDLLKQHGLQIQATAEHKNITKRDDRYKVVLGELQKIRTQLDAIRAAMPRGGAVRF